MQDDDDRTLLHPGVGSEKSDPDATVIYKSAQPKTTGQAAMQPDGEYLPNGYRLQEFEVLERLGQGGFSIVYKARDHSLHRDIALKEYMPSSMTRRLNNCSVEVKADRHRDTFSAGLRSFIEEAKTLASFNHPALVQVFRYFEANGTAYMAMQLAMGVTLEKAVNDLPGPPDEPWLRELLDPLTAALQVVHARGIAHRDIAPDNIVILNGSRRPLLLDFGAARQVIGDDTANPTAMLKPSYAPIEQYPETGLQQGAHTDVYALSAVVHRLLIGRAPPNSQSRSMRDSYEPLARRLSGKYSEQLLKAVDHGLVVHPDKRTPTIDAFRQEIGLDVGSSAWGRVAKDEKNTPHQKKPIMLWGGIAALALLIGSGLAWWAATPGKLEPVPKQMPMATPQPSVPLSTTPPVPSPMPASVELPVLPVDAEGAFAHVLAGATPGVTVSFELETTELKVNRTPLRMKLTSSVSGFFYILLHDTDGKIRILLPDEMDKDNQINGGQVISLPRPLVNPATKAILTSGIEFGEPIGAARLMAIVSETPLDYSVVTDAVDGGYSVLMDSEKAKQWQITSSGRSFLLGKLACQSTNPCSARYGAADARFRVVR